MRKHILIELQKIIEVRIGSLIEEVEIATNLKLNPLYIADRRDEIEFVQWTVVVISSILNRDIDERQQLGATKERLAGFCTSWCQSPELVADTGCCLHTQTRLAEGYFCLIFYL